MLDYGISYIYNSLTNAVRQVAYWNCYSRVKPANMLKYISHYSAIIKHTEVTLLRC